MAMALRRLLAQPSAKSAPGRPAANGSRCLRRHCETRKRAIGGAVAAAQYRTTGDGRHLEPKGRPGADLVGARSERRPIARAYEKTGELQPLVFNNVDNISHV